MEDHADLIPSVVKQTKELIPKAFQRPLFWVATELAHFFPAEIVEEMRGIADVTGLPLGEVIGINILYDITDFNRSFLSGRGNHSLALGCTSIVAEDSKGRIWHGRNLDYEMGTLLRNLTVIVDFVRDGKSQFSGTTFVLCVGLLTGQRPMGFSLSLNARFSGGYWDNILMELVTRFHNPVSLELRKTLDRATTFDEALKHLSTVHFVAPSYIIVGGVRSGEGAIITRNRWASADILRLDTGKGRWFLLEANYDHWKKTDDPRKKMGNKFMNDVGQDAINAQSLFAVVSKPPLLNNRTIYTSVFSAARPQLLYEYTSIRNGGF